MTILKSPSGMSIYMSIYILYTVGPELIFQIVYISYGDSTYSMLVADIKIIQEMYVRQHIECNWDCTCQCHHYTRHDYAIMQQHHYLNVFTVILLQLHQTNPLSNQRTALFSLLPNWTIEILQGCTSGYCHKLVITVAGKGHTHKKIF